MRDKVVMHVEDSEYNRKYIKNPLSRKHYLLMEARDREAALDALTRHRPDLILMNVQLPKLSGLEAIRRIKADPMLTHE